MIQFVFLREWMNEQLQTILFLAVALQPFLPLDCPVYVKAVKDEMIFIFHSPLISQWNISIIFLFSYISVYFQELPSKMKWVNDFHKSLFLWIYVGFQPISKANILGFSFFDFGKQHTKCGMVGVVFCVKEVETKLHIGNSWANRRMSATSVLGMEWRMATTRHSFVMHYILLPHLSSISCPSSLSSPFLVLFPSFQFSNF